MSDKEPFILVKDNLHPEDNAMVQAMYSRSPASVLSHLEKVEKTGSGKFMDTFYVGYGHKSIGDCGNTTIFVENVSMLVAKAIQDSGLYKGQEASTRYLDFSSQRVHDPFNHPYTTQLQQHWMDLYNQYLPIIIDALKIAYPLSLENVDLSSQYEKTIKAKAFDIVRSLLPIGATTNLSFDTTLSHAREHLRFLFGHPLEEVNNTVSKVHNQLYQAYPHSFDQAIITDSDKDRAFLHALDEDLGNYYLTYNTVRNRLSPEDFRQMINGQVVVTTDSIDTDAINFEHHDALLRPTRTPLPRYLNQYGVYNFYFTLDFGSFRDIQRHRNGFCPIPLVTNHVGFHSWYDDEFKKLLTPAAYRILRNRIQELLDMIDNVDRHVGIVTDFEKQYLYPMGISCVCQLAYALPQTVYVAELRSQTTVHDSLRQRVHQIGDILEELHPSLNLFMDRTAFSFNLKRGDQDIVEITPS